MEGREVRAVEGRRFFRARISLRRKGYGLGAATSPKMHPWTPRLRV